MKPSVIIIAILVGLAAGIFLYKKVSPPPASPQKLTLEQVLYIKELHLVKHTYTDLFFLHKQNNPRKAIRAVVQVPVTVTAYIDLKQVRIVKQNDSIRQVILPHARLNEPNYHVDKLIVRETRSVQVHVGKDLYPQVSSYLQTAMAERMQQVRTLAVSNEIIVQAETEAKHYIESILIALGHHHVRVTFSTDVPPTTPNQTPASFLVLSHIQ